MGGQTPQHDEHDEHEGILTATRGVHAPPEMRPGSGRPQRRYVSLLLGACLLLVAAVGAFNAYVDPYATVGTRAVGPVIWTDRKVKVKLIERLTVPPHVIVFGSSRAMKVEPHYITHLTGEPAFNAAVSDGKPIDTYVFARLLHDRFPGTHEEYLWLLDQEAFAPEPIDPGLLTTGRLARYLPRGTRVSGRLTDLSWLLSWRTLATSWRTWRHQQKQQVVGALSPAPGKTPGGKPPEFLPDGFRAVDTNDRKAARGRTLEKGIAASYDTFAQRYRGHYPGLAPAQKAWFERTLALMNGWGSTPVLVLSPVHPQLLAELRPLGWEQRHREVLAYLSSLQATYRFVLLDMSDIASFGGSPKLFFDGVHMKVRNYRRLLRTVLADPAAASALGGTK